MNVLLMVYGSVTGAWTRFSMARPYWPAAMESESWLGGYEEGLTASDASVLTITVAWASYASRAR